MVGAGGGDILLCIQSHHLVRNEIFLDTDTRIVKLRDRIFELCTGPVFCPHRIEFPTCVSVRGGTAQPLCEFSKVIAIGYRVTLHIASPAEGTIGWRHPNVCNPEGFQLLGILCQLCIGVLVVRLEQAEPLKDHMIVIRGQ